MRITVVVCAAAAAFALGMSAPAGAQTYDSVGTRAQGMGGAFVAVADDATATWWNPAGLAGGAYFSAVVEGGRRDDPGVVGSPGTAAGRTDRSAVALAYPALGLSYYRLRISEIAGIDPTAAVAAGRQDQGPAAMRLRSLLLQQFGATVGQSIGDHLVVGSTLKLLRGSVGGEIRPASAASIDAAAGLSGSSATHADLDLGAIASFGHVRMGIAARNLREVSFGDGDNAIELARQVRAGIAFSTLHGGLDDGVTVAADADLTRTPTVTGDVRRAAGGIEGWMFRRRIGVRGGVSANTVGDARPAASAGVSLGLRSGLFLDGAVTRGADTARRGWEIGARVTF